MKTSRDGLCSYIDAIGESCAGTSVDYAQLRKTYEAEATGPGRYSLPKVTSTEKTPISGEPVTKFVSTS